MVAGRRVALLIEPDTSLGYVISAVLKRNDFEVISAVAIEEAVQKMKGRDVKIALVATELKTERYTGIDVCRAINRSYRGKIPVLVTSREPTEQNIIRSIKAGALDFLVKPISEQILLQKIESAMNRGNTQFIVANNLKDLEFSPEMTLSEMVDVVINEADEIRALPQAVAKITQVSEDEKSGAKAMEQAINSDPSIAGMVLKRANSAFYKGNASIVSVKQAVIRIGFNECRKMVLGLSLIKLFSTEDKSFGFNRLHFWLHSVAVGVLAELLSKKSKAEHGDDSFLSGLLHDFGKLVLDDYLSVPFQKSLQLANINNLTLFESENNVFERTHSAISKSVMEKWNFPDHVVNAVLRHHVEPRPDPQKGITPGINESLFLANQMAKVSLLGHSGDTIATKVSDTLWSAYGFTEDVFEDEFIATYFKKVSEFLEFLGIGEKELKKTIGVPEENGTIIVLKSLEQDHRSLVFFLQCQGYKVVCVKEGSDIPAELEPKVVICQIQERDSANDMLKDAIVKYPEVHIVFLSGKIRYKNELIPENQLRVIEGRFDAQLLALNIK